MNERNDEWLLSTILRRSLLLSLFNENLGRYLEEQTKGAHFERFFQIDIRMNAQLSQGISNQVISTNMKNQKGASGQQRLQGEKHEDVLQVGSIDRHLEQHIPKHSYSTQHIPGSRDQPAVVQDLSGITAFSCLFFPLNFHRFSS